MKYTEKDIQKMTDLSHALLKNLTTVTANYIAMLDHPSYTAIIVQGALGIYMKNVVEATIHSMQCSRQERIDFIIKFKNVMLETLSEINVDNFEIRKH